MVAATYVPFGNHFFFIRRNRTSKSTGQQEPNTKKLLTKYQVAFYNIKLMEFAPLNVQKYLKKGQNILVQTFQKIILTFLI